MEGGKPGVVATLARQNRASRWQSPTQVTDRVSQLCQDFRPAGHSAITEKAQATGAGGGDSINWLLSPDRSRTKWHVL